MQQPLLSILIPTLDSRASIYGRLLFNLHYAIQTYALPGEVEVIPYVDAGEQSTGYKRNWLINNCNGKYIAFVDDDDMVTDAYIPAQLAVCNSNADCGSLTGLYFLNGIYDRPFIHSIAYKSWYQDNQFYYRCPNHLNAIKKELIADIPFQDKVVGEDGNWSMDILNAGRLKTEHKVLQTLYLYYCTSKNI